MFQKLSAEVSEQSTADLLKDAWQLLLSHSFCFITELNSHKDSVFSLVDVSVHRQDSRWPVFASRAIIP